MAPEDRRGRAGAAVGAGSGRRLLMFLVLVLVLMAAYYFLVGGPGSGTGEDPAGSQAARAPGGGDPDPLGELGGPGETAGDAGGDAGDEATGEAPSAGEPERTVEEAGDDAVPARPVAREEPVESQGDASSGARPEPSAGDDERPAPDPLGLREEGQREGELSGQRLSASNYVTYAFGYTGKDPEQYRSNVEEAVLGEDFYASPGGGYVEQTAERMGEAPNGVRSAAILKDFRLLPGGGQGGVEGVAGGDGPEYRAVLTFDVGEAYGRTGLEGETTRYTQDVRLAEWRPNYWKVKTAGPVVPEAGSEAQPEAGG